eukprot:scaffold3083_cov440-Prasinococcus_capsulatus_cf.AAC.5
MLARSPAARGTFKRLAYIADPQNLAAGRATARRAAVARGHAAWVVRRIGFLGRVTHTYKITLCVVQAFSIRDACPVRVEEETPRLTRRQLPACAARSTLAIGEASHFPGGLSRSRAPRVALGGVTNA